MIRHKLSHLFQPRIIVPPGRERGAELTSTSQKLLSNLGLVRSNVGATNVLLPIAVRAIEKLKRLIQIELESLGAQEIALPALTPQQLFKETGRDSLPELFTLKDRHGKQFILSPTHEEAVVSLIASIRPSYKSLPLLLYQMTSKFRDEIKPRFGLMRSKEFLMKDLYCFETSAESSRQSYDKINDCYHRIFQGLNVPYCCIEGCTGEIGGTLSHEFHILSHVGEDKVVLCEDCGHGENITNSGHILTCVGCEGHNTSQRNAIEVGHSFLLGTRYTKPLNAVFIAPDHSHQLLEMSCHGIGLTRLLAAGVEVLSTPQEIRWPNSTAPFSVCIIPPKEGSKEEMTSVSLEELHLALTQAIGDDIVVDDRIHLTIGKRMAEATQMGYPYVVVIGRPAMQDPPQLELHDIHHGSLDLVRPTDAPNVIKQRLKI